MLFVLPEYAGAFPAAVPLMPRLRETGSWEEIEKELRRREGEKVFHRFFLERAPAVRRWMDEFYGSWARKHRVWLLAGTYFAAEGEELRNRAVLYGPGGRAVYEQDKVYLTPFEKKTLELAPGRVEEARIFEAAGMRCALTICRDSFFPEWEEPFETADLWIELKGNGARWDAESRELFDRALPERIAAGGPPWGLTVTLVGKLHDMLWEGPSALIRREEDARRGWIRPWTASSVREAEVKVLRIPPGSR
jgi:hypothetical protein